MAKQMKKFLKWFLIVVASLVAIFVVGGLMLPTKWSVSESNTIAASPEDIYAEIANLRNWQNWSPWNKEMDPTQVYSYEGPDVGAGAKWLWTSEKMGTGWLEIKESDPNKGIVYGLFIDMDGNQSTIHGDISYHLVDGAVKVTWIDVGESGNNIMKRWMALLIKHILGNEMRDGLKKLKDITEKKQ